MDFFHYISAKIDREETRALTDNNPKIIQNEYIEINLNKNKRTKTINNRITDNPESYNSDDFLSGSQYSLERSFLNYQKTKSEQLEDLINKILINNIEDNIEKENLILLPNILYMFNLKIPVVNEENNLDFKSVHLEFFDKNTKGDINNYYYGCKEIDAIFENNSENACPALDSNYFSTNLTYLKKDNKDNTFSLIDNSNFFINPKSILFCEIKDYFPNKQNGREKALSVKVEKSPKTINNINDYISEDDTLYPYNE